MPDKSDKKVCGMPAHYVKFVGIGAVVVALVITGIVLGVVLTRDDGAGDADDRPWDTDYRLPEQLHAENYELLLHPDMVTDEFSGRLTLTLRLTAPLAYLPLHQKGLNVSNPALEKVQPTPPHKSLKVIDIAESFDATKNEFFIVRPKSTLDAGSYKLSVDFEGSLRQPELVGIYSSSYVVTGPGPPVPKKLVTSKFEPTYARRAFPCLDEPDRKATFAISLVKPKDASTKWTALSNMNENGTVPGPGANEETTTFATSVNMSTYLACFIVSEFRSLAGEVINLDGKPFDVRTFAPAHLTVNTEFARDAAVSITSYYIEYFNIGYPLPKLDLIAIPDFVSGAMEHWGLITFRETNMLVDQDENKNAVSSMQQVGMVVAHELAHMWFGNLVTMKWWDDLWLNEGFASYIEYKGLAHFKPDWRLMDQFLIMDLQPVMALDAQLSSHPIIQPVAHPDQITELFDTITYSKGSSVIRMLEGIVGEDVFKAGVTSYLRKFEYDNAVTKDLWAALTEAAEAAGQSIDVARVMDTWTLQMGLPVVDVTYDATTGRAVLRQKRFFATPNAEKKAATLKATSPFSYRWDVPLTFYTNFNPKTQTKWLKMEDSTVEINFDPVGTKWIKINRGQIGFYRVNYDSDMWTQLGQAAKNLEMSGADRSSLLDDIFSLADGNYLNYTQALDFAKYLSTEDDYIAWSTASSKFLKMLPFIKTKLAYTDFKEFVATMVKKQYNSLEWEEKTGDDFVTKRLRSTVLNVACSCDYGACLGTASTNFNNWIGDVTKLPPVNTRQLVYNFGMKQRGHFNGIWDKVWGLYSTEKDAQEKLKLMVSLSYVRDNVLLNKYLTLAEDEANVRGQDYFTVLQSISDNDLGQQLVWNYVRNNWEKLVERFTLNSRSLGRLIPRITQNFDTQIQLDEIKAFFAKYPDAGAGASARKQALERVEANMQWLTLHYDNIESWLKTWNTPVPPV